MSAGNGKPGWVELQRRFNKGSSERELDAELSAHVVFSHDWDVSCGHDLRFGVPVGALILAVSPVMAKAKRAKEEHIEIEAGSGNVFEDLGLADAGGRLAESSRA
jgi:hypothetical protein